MRHSRCHRLALSAGFLTLQEPECRCGQFAERLGLEGDELESVRHAAELHDIGKVAIPDAILNKPGKLTDSEFKEIPWRHGVMYAPPFWMMHQHFNTSPVPARYLACSLGSRRYSALRTSRLAWWK